MSAKPLRREVDPSTDDEEIFPTKSDDLSDAGAPEIVRTKYFMLDPMTPAEAVDLVSHWHGDGLTCFCVDPDHCCLVAPCYSCHD